MENEAIFAPDFHVQRLQNTAFKMNWCWDDTIDTDSVFPAGFKDFLGTGTEIRLYFADNKQN